MLVSSPAKLNRYLAIKGKRSDGYHEVELISTTLDHVSQLSDDIELVKSQDFDFICEGPESNGVPNNEDNLVLRALRLIEQKWNTQLLIRLRVHKRIPHGAGLGGGSSNAASVLKSLPTLFDRPIPESELLAMASQLGSDVPLFILGGTTLGLNKGEKVERLPSLTIGPQIIVNTGLSIRTEEVYKCINHDFFPPSSIKDLLMSGQSIPRRNDLAPFAYQVNSNLQKIASVLSGTGGDAMLCGSGGCFSALYTSDDACRSAMHWLHEHKPHWKVYNIGLPR